MTLTFACHAFSSFRSLFSYSDSLSTPPTRSTDKTRLCCRVLVGSVNKLLVDDSFSSITKLNFRVHKLVICGQKEANVVLQSMVPRNCPLNGAKTTTCIVKIS